MINVENVYKFYDDVTAVKGISFDVSPGQIFGLLGPNGAGKTTTMRMMYGLIQPNKGRIVIAGEPITHHSHTIREKIGILPDGVALYSRLTAHENIAYFGRLHGMPASAIDQRITLLADQLGFENILNRKVYGFSQGQKMKVALARALIHDPDYLFLDEPTNGLDVITTRAVRHLLLDLKAKNKTILFSSHLMHEVEYLCDEVGIIKHGKLVAQGSINSILQLGQHGHFEEAFVQLAYDNKELKN